MKYFLTGGTGFIGSWLAAKLAESGAEVCCLVRPGSKLRWLEGLPIDLCEGTLFDEASLLKGLARADYVLHLAGAVKALSKRDCNYSAWIE